MAVPARVGRVAHDNWIRTPTAIREVWSEDDDLEDVMDVVYSESRSAIGKTRKDVLRVAGLD